MMKRKKKETRVEERWTAAVCLHALVYIEEAFIFERGKAHS